MSLPEPTDRIFDMGTYRIGDPGGRIGFTLARGRPYEWRLLYQIRSLGLSGSAFDVGAHVGNHSLWMAAECGLKVHAFEPHWPSLDQLFDNLSLNPELDVTVHTWAAGDRETRGRLTSGMWVEFDPSRDGAALKTGRGHIPVHRIDDVLDVPDLVVVKIDVEGMEAMVLSGMVRHIADNRPVIYCETHDQEAQDKIAAVLEPLGYTLGQVIQMGSPQHRWDPQ